MYRCPRASDSVMSLLDYDHIVVPTNCNGPYQATYLVNYTTLM